MALIGSYFLEEASCYFIYLGPVIFSCYADIHGMADSRTVEMCLRMQPGS